MKQASTKDEPRSVILEMRCIFEERPRVSRKLKKLPVMLKLISIATELRKDELKSDLNGFL